MRDSHLTPNNSSMHETLVSKAAAVLGLSLVLGAALAQVAAAAPVARKSLDGSIHTTGLTDYGSYKLAYKAIDPTRSVSVNACGVAKLTTNASFSLSDSSNLSVSSGTPWLSWLCADKTNGYRYKAGQRGVERPESVPIVEKP